MAQVWDKAGLDILLEKFSANRRLSSDWQSRCRELLGETHTVEEALDCLRQIAELPLSEVSLFVKTTCELVLNRSANPQLVRES